MAGIYTVCLTVGNVNGSSTYCKEVVVTGVSGSDDVPLSTTPVSLYPNPANDYLRITGLSLTDGQQAAVALLDVNGKVVSETTLETGQNTLQTGHLPEGVYCCRIWQGEHQISFQKVVILH